MSVAEKCGVEDREGVLLAAARAAWRRWCHEDPSMAVVDDLLDLRAWTPTAGPAARGGVVAAIAIRTREEPAAVTALVWLLIPGAQQMAAQLGDLSSDIDTLVAGQLWIEAAAAWEAKPSRSAQEILRRVRRGVCAELGVGDAGLRGDRTWASVVRTAVFDDRPAPPQPADDDDDDDYWLVTELLIEAMKDHAIHLFDAWLVGELAYVAAQVGAPGHRGRQGLTTPTVVEFVGEDVRLSTRTLRRRACKTIDRLAEYVAVRDDPQRFAEWKARHPAAALSASDEMQLVITEDDTAYWVRTRSLDVEGQASDDRDRQSPGIA